MSKGIDPATHRTINEAKVVGDLPELKKTEDHIVKDIYFGSMYEKTEKFGDQKQNKRSRNGLVCKEERVDYYYPVVVEEEICPDLNLELRISPPWQTRSHDTYTASRFYKENGIEFSSETAKCQTEDSSSISYSSIDISSNNVGYDFLGLKTRVLDLRSLEMK